MRRFLYCAALIVMPVAAMAHGDAEELGHHWEVGSYSSELRFQIALMAIATVVILGGRFLLRFLRDRGASR